MLVISRKKDESIVIGDNIEILISDISTDKVKICIKAPKDIKVLRKELIETEKLNQEASIVPEISIIQKLNTLLK